MKVIVKKGYVVYHNGWRFNGGEEVPPHLTKVILTNQSWKVEVYEDGKKEESETGGNTTEETKEGEKEIKDIVSDKMMKEKHTKKRGL